MVKELYEKEVAAMSHKLYRYRLSKFELIAPELDGPVDLVPGSVSMMYIGKDYDTDFYPMLMLNFVINPKVKEFIEIRRNEVKFHIALRCEGYDVTGSGSRTDPVSSETVFDTIFIPVISSNVPFMDLAVYNKTVNELQNIAASGGSVNDLGGKNMTADFRERVSYYFYVERDLVNSKNVVNKVYSGTDIPTICADILSKNGFDAILMSPSDNKDPIDQCIIQPQNLLNLFQYLSEIYGMHQTGTTTFFDYRCVYIMNKTGHPDCVEEGEYPTTIFTVNKTILSESWLSGTTTCDERKEYYIFPDPHRVIMHNPASINDHIMGNNLTALNAKDNAPTHIEGTGEQRGKGNTRVDNNANANPYMQTQYANDIQEGNMSVKMTVFDPYMWALTPNKEFILHYLDSNVDPTYSGYYRIRKTDFLFNRNGTQLTLTANIDMVKKEPIDDAIKNAIETQVVPSPLLVQSSSGGVTRGKGLPGVG